MSNSSTVCPPQLADLSKKNRGEAVERFVAIFLENHTVRLIDKNFRSRFGEIDLIGIHQNQVVFLEVRFRKSGAYGSAAASVTARKQRKLIQTARFFLCKTPWLANKACRFDVVAVTLSNGEYEIEWFQHAFY